MDQFWDDQAKTHLLGEHSFLYSLDEIKLFKTIVHVNFTFPQMLNNKIQTRTSSRVNFVDVLKI